MPGVSRSSVNLTRWRGAVPNPLNAGRVDAFLGAGSVGDVQAGVAREASVQVTITGINGANNTLAGYMPYLPQIDTRVAAIAANGAQQSTVVGTQNAVNGIATNGAKEASVQDVRNYVVPTYSQVNAIAANGAQQSTLVATQAAVNNLAASTNVGTWAGVGVRALVDGRVEAVASIVSDKANYDVLSWRGHPVSGAVVNGFIPVYIPALQTGTVTISSLLDAMTANEALALEQLAEQPGTDAGRLVRMFYRRLLVNTIVDVEPVLALVTRLRPILIEAGVWTSATAAPRINAWFTPPKAPEVAPTKQ